MRRKRLAACLLAACLTVPLSPDTSSAMTRADRRAILELVVAYRAWLRGLAIVPFTGPECPGRWAVPTVVVWRESRCMPGVRNPLPGSTAGGAYQMVARSRDWALRAAGLAEYVGTPAEHLPLWVQHRAAHELWQDSPCHWAPNAWC